MTVERPDASVADDLADLWVDLAAGQRDHGSAVRASANRTAIREQLARQIVTGDVRVARDGDRIVGFVTVTLDSVPLQRDRTRGVVENLYVVPDRRGEGIGSALLDAAVNLLAERDVDVVTLEVLADNEAARRFYRRHDFEPHRVEMAASIDSLSRDDG